MVVFKVIRVKSWSKLLLFMLFILVLIGAVSGVSANDSVTDVIVSDASVSAIALESQDLNENNDELNIQILSLNNNNLNDEDLNLINSKDIIDDSSELNEIYISNLNTVSNDLTNVGMFDVQATLAINSSKITLGEKIKLTPTVKENIRHNIIKTGEVVYYLSNGVKIGNSSADGYLEYTPTVPGVYWFYAYFIPDNLHIYNLWQLDATNHVYLLVLSSSNDTQANDSDISNNQNETVNNTIVDNNHTVVNDDAIILPDGNFQKINVKIIGIKSSTSDDVISYIILVNNESDNSTDVAVTRTLPADNNIDYSRIEYNNPTATAAIGVAAIALSLLWLLVFIRV